LVEPEQVIKLFQPIDEKEMEEWQVPDEAKNPRNDSPKLIDHIRK